MRSPHPLLTAAAFLATVLALPLPSAHADVVAAPPKGAAHLEHDLVAYGATRATTMSVMVLDTRSGASWTYRPAGHYDNASVVKVNILQTVLWRAQQEGRDLTAWERARAEPMIRRSDNDADRLRKYLARFGLAFADTKRA